MTATITRDPEVVEAPTEPGDHDRFAHVVNKSAMADAYVFGTPLEALCGKRWVPSADPKKFPVCPRCKELVEEVFGEWPEAVR